MILVNTDYISGKNFEMIGLVRGTMIQSVHFGKDHEQFQDSGRRRAYILYRDDE